MYGKIAVVYDGDRDDIVDMADAVAKGAEDAGGKVDMFTAEEKPTAYMDFDGYRVEFPQWWFNIRPSNTEPYLRFICEATSKQLLDEKVSAVRDLLTTRFGAK